MARQEGECFTRSKKVTLKNISTFDVASALAEKLTGYITGNYENDYNIIGMVNGSEVYIHVSQSDHSRSHGANPFGPDHGEYINPNEFKVETVEIDSTGDRKALDEIDRLTRNDFKEAEVSQIRWWYVQRGSPEKRVMFLDKPTTTLKAEYYPYLKEHPSDYLKRYLSSDQSILLMAGPPGTGKTTLIRHLITDFSLMADVIYDPSLMNNDFVFQNFLWDSKSKVMIIEDADNLLAKSGEERSTLMTRFLNVSDGIVKLPEKKLIFTTNINDFDTLDPALTRPGRCFDILKSRELTFEEAQRVAQVSSLPELTLDKKYTLAEIFNQSDNREVR